MIGKYFLPDCGLVFHLHNIASQRSEVLNIDQVQFINFHFLDHVFGVKYAKSLRNSKSQILCVLFFYVWDYAQFTEHIMKGTDVLHWSFSHIEVPRFQHHLLPKLSFLC